MGTKKWGQIYFLSRSLPRPRIREKIDLSPFLCVPISLSAFSGPHFLLHSLRSISGAVAQLGERRVRNAKVESSILFGSTKFTVSFHRPGSSAG